MTITLLLIILGVLALVSIWGIGKLLDSEESTRRDKTIIVVHDLLLSGLFRLKRKQDGVG